MGELNMTALWHFGQEFTGNLKDPDVGLTIKELMHLAELYPEIWGKYDRAYPEEKGQDFNNGVPEQLQSDQVGPKGGADEQEGTGDIQPKPGWTTDQIGFDTYEKGL